MTLIHADGGRGLEPTTFNFDGKATFHIGIDFISRPKPDEGCAALLHTWEADFTLPTAVTQTPVTVDLTDITTGLSSTLLSQ